MKTPKHILVTEMPYILLSFLIKKKALRQFLTAVTKYSNAHNNVTAIKWVKSYYSKHCIDMIFLSSFTWRYTSQGYEFWLNISMEWEKLWRQKTL